MAAVCEGIPLAKMRTNRARRLRDECIRGSDQAGGAEVAQDRPQFPQIGAGLLRRADIGFGDDLHQRDAGPVQVDQRLGGVLVVDRLAGILLQVKAGDADNLCGAVGEFDLDLTRADDRMLILADLIALRQIGVEIVLPVEAADGVDARVQPEAGSHGLGDAFAVNDRQHAGEAGIDEADLTVRLRAECGGGAAEQLGVADDLGVDFKADDHLPGAG